MGPGEREKPGQKKGTREEEHTHRWEEQRDEREGKVEGSEGKRWDGGRRKIGSGGGLHRLREIAASFLGRQLITDIMF